MNKKFFFSCFICILIFFLSSTFYFNKQTIIESENRSITTFPELPKKISTSKIKHFFRQLSKFYNDNFPDREKIILTINSLLPSINPELVSFNKVVIGRNDWVFLGNDYANTIDKLIGKLYYSDNNKKFFNTTTRYDYYKKVADNILSQNKKLFFLIPPNKSSVYPEFLPKTIVPASKPFHEELLQKMRKEGLNVYYPHQDFLQAKKKARLYYVTDTHWNNYGAFIAFINLLPQLNPDYRNILKEEDFSFKPMKSYPGDLISIGNLTFKNKDYQDNLEIMYTNIPFKTADAIKIIDQFFLGDSAVACTIDNDIFQTAVNDQLKLIQIINQNALIDKSVWVIGDSFSKALGPYFTFVFKNCYFIHKDNFIEIPFTEFADIHADYIIFECVERGF